MSSEYDVIIVGGRPTGASLAARLGARGMKVLIVDRTTFPSLPSVPSSPAIHPGAMKLLDELGIDEAAYADDHARMRGFAIDVAGIFTVDIAMPMMAAGRSYTYGVDRTTFDDLLWRNLARFPTVERREGFTVTDLLREDGRVIGIEGGPRGEPPSRITAGCVVGADGRFSFVARRASAEVVEERDAHTSTVYFADWEGVRPAHDKYSSAYIHATGRGLDVLFFAMPNGRYSVNTHARSDRVQVDGDPERYYLETLRSVPNIWRYLDRAQRVSPILGIKKIGNGYRRPSGPGWVLAGDALHYKDPVDGQGIYDALLGTKLLDPALASWWSGEKSWGEAMATYKQTFWAATQPMFLATTGRLERELYDEPSLPLIHTVLRWTLNDPAYQETFARVLARDWPPSSLDSKRMMVSAIARGVGVDVRGWLRRRLSVPR